MSPGLGVYCHCGLQPFTAHSHNIGNFFRILVIPVKRSGFVLPNAILHKHVATLNYKWLGRKIKYFEFIVQMYNVTVNRFGFSTVWPETVYPDQWCFQRVYTTYAVYNILSWFFLIYHEYTACTVLTSFK